MNILKYENFIDLKNTEYITLYHGSKYLFSQFDISKVNTGQHSQDFGYGLYFTSDYDSMLTNYPIS